MTSIMPPYIGNQPFRKAAQEFAKGAQQYGSPGNWKVTAEELETYEQLVEMSNYGGGRMTTDQAIDMMSDFARARFTTEDGAQQKYQTAIRQALEDLGIQPPPDPTDPPIVALYSVAINEAAASGDADRMSKVARLAEVALAPYEGTNMRALSHFDRPAYMALSAGARHDPTNTTTRSGFLGDVRAALQNLKAAMDG